MRQFHLGIDDPLEDTGFVIHRSRHLCKRIVSTIPPLEGKILYPYLVFDLQHSLVLDASGLLLVRCRRAVLL